MRVPKPNLQKVIHQCNLIKNFIKKFNSITEDYFFLEKSRNSCGIRCCLKEKQKTAYGYIWKES